MKRKAADIFAPEWVLRHKLYAIRDHYYKYPYLTEQVELFVGYCELIKQEKLIELVGEDILWGKNVIFEGSQGILLDRDHGMFPHVTRAHTTSKNAMEIISRNHLAEPSVYYVTRPYLIRHGNGPFKAGTVELQNTEGEINKTNEWQGSIRIAPFDMDLFNYAISCDPYNQAEHFYHNIVVTCMDQPVGRIPIVRKGKTDYTSKEAFPFLLNAHPIISDDYIFKHL